MAFETLKCYLLKHVYLSVILYLFLLRGHSEMIELLLTIAHLGGRTRQQILSM